VITEEVDAPEASGPSESGFARRHPVVAYVFGDMIRGFYVVACLGLDLFAPVQLRLWFPGMDVIVPAGRRGHPRARVRRVATLLATVAWFKRATRRQGSSAVAVRPAREG